MSEWVRAFARACLYVCVCMCLRERACIFSEDLFSYCAHLPIRARVYVCSTRCCIDLLMRHPPHPPSSLRSVYNEIKTHLPAMYLLAEDERQHEHHISGVGQYRLFLWKNGLIIIENSMLLPTSFELSNVTLTAIFKKQTDDKKLKTKQKTWTQIKIK